MPSSPVLKVTPVDVAKALTSLFDDTAVVLTSATVLATGRTAAAAIARAWGSHPELVMHELETAMISSLLYLKGQAAERSKLRPDGQEGANRGHLARSFDHRVTMFMDAVFGDVTNPLSYALPVELGTRPHYPPIDPLIDWVEAKLGLAGEEAESAARGIQRNIGRRGSVGRFMARDALAAGGSSIQGEFEDAAERIVTKLAQLGLGGTA